MSPANFARFIGDFRNAALNASECIAMLSRTSVAASFPATNSRAANGECSARFCENLTFHGQQDWEMCRHDRFEVERSTGRVKLTRPRDQRRFLIWISQNVRRPPARQPLPLGLAPRQAAQLS